MGLMSSALRALGLTSADASTADGRDAALLVDGALARGGALWTRARTLVRASGAVATAFYELTIDPTNGGLNVNLAGGAVGGSTVAQGDPNADATKGWPVRLFNATGQLLGRLAAAASLPVALSTEDFAALGAVASQITAAAILAKIIAAPATEAKQDTAITSLATIAAAQPYLKPPGSRTAITPSDGTDVTAVASIGLVVTSIAIGSTLATQCVNTHTTVTETVVAGQYIYGQFYRVMAATNCTVVGLAP